MRLYEWFESKTNIYMVMELCTGGELFDKINKVGHFDEQVASQLFRQMMHALRYCHSKHVCHKDLKPENFLFATTDPDADIKLIDFGLSQAYSAASTHPLIGILITSRCREENDGQSGDRTSASDSVAVLHSPRSD